MDILNVVALIMLFIISITFVYVVIYIHDIPYEIAKKRNHPHQDAIHVAGWVSLFLMHALWPFLWIWAYLFKPDSPAMITVKAEHDAEQMNKLTEELLALKEEVNALKGKKEAAASKGETQKK